MREAEWLKSDDAVQMLESMSGSASDRKLRLLAAGYCRHFAAARKKVRLETRW